MQFAARSRGTPARCTGVACLARSRLLGFPPFRLRGRGLAPRCGMPRRRKRKTEERSWYEFEAVLPSQFFNPQTRSSLQPEKRLMLAVLEDAVLLYTRVPQIAPETEAWVQADDRTWPYSFVNLCDALGLDRSAVRVALRRQRERRRLAA